MAQCLRSMVNIRSRWPMNSQRLSLFQHFNIVVVEQFVDVDDALMVTDSVEQQCVPGALGYSSLYPACFSSI